VSPSSKLLFGDDLVEQIRDAKETSCIGYTVGAYTKHDHSRSTPTNTALLTLRGVACVLGKIVSSFPGVIYGLSLYRHAEHDKTRALRTNQWNFDKHMSLSLE